MGKYRLFIWILFAALRGFSQASAQPLCCASAVECQKIAAECLSSEGMPNTCKALAAITQHKWQLHNYDFRPLTRQQKDLAGTYQLNLQNMTLLNEWQIDDAPGIQQNGRSKIKVKEICFDQSSMMISASVFLSNFQMIFLTEMKSLQKGDTMVDGFEMQAKKVRYFFLQAD